jgi:hypothetical protein
VKKSPDPNRNVYRSESVGESLPFMFMRSQAGTQIANGTSP